MQQGAEAPRLAEAVAALAVATDMGTGKELGRSLRTTLVGIRLGTRLGPDAERLSTTYYTGMLGCTGESTAAASILGGAGGREAWTAILQRRRGRTLDPAVVDAALADPAPLDECLHLPSPWDEVPADFVDLKSDTMTGHSRAVAALAATVAAVEAVVSASDEQARVSRPAAAAG